jgi:hypothetical protein
MDKNFSEMLDTVRERLGINKFNLEDEAVNQPLLLEEVGRYKTEAKALAKSAKDNLDLTMASIRLDVNRNPGKFGFEKKPNEDTIEAITITQSQGELSVCRDLEEQSMAWDIVYDAVEQRKTLITQAVTLYVHEYYSGKPMEAEQEVLREQGIDAVKEYRRKKLQERAENGVSERVMEGNK